MADEPSEVEITDAANEPAGPGERGMRPLEAIERAHVKAPTRGNRRLEALLEGINADPEVRGWWHMPFPGGPGRRLRQGRG